MLRKIIEEKEDFDQLTIFRNEGSDYFAKNIAGSFWKYTRRRSSIE